MVILQKATTNNNIVFYDLKSDSSLSSPVYLFVFSKGGNDYPVISTDLSTTAQKEVYSKFTFIEGVDDPENGSFLLGSTGVYDLVIYEQSSTTNLDPDNATKIQTHLDRDWETPSIKVNLE